MVIVVRFLLVDVDMVVLAGVELVDVDEDVVDNGVVLVDIDVDVIVVVGVHVDVAVVEEVALVDYLLM